MNMELNRYGVTLRRLTTDKIELVRNWRNDPKISNYMFFKEYITQEMQLTWFNQVNNDLNYYFIINYKNEEIGLINLKNIDKQKNCAEGGIFIYDEKYLNSDIAFRSSFCINDFAFEELYLNFIYAEIVPDNKRAIQYNKALGFKIEASKDNKSLLATLTRENYFKQRNKYARILI